MDFDFLPMGKPGVEDARAGAVRQSSVSSAGIRLFHHSSVMTVLKAHGVTATWSARLNHKGLSQESQEAFRRINLRWHDLRHEYASRLVEQGVPLAQVRDLLGHASITTTERYDNQKLENLQIAVTKLERGQMFAVPPAVPTVSRDAGNTSGGTEVPPYVHTHAGVSDRA